MIQIFTIRQYYDKISESTKMARLPFNKTGSSIKSLFANMKSVIESIPEEERWNLHYSLGSYNKDDLTGFINQEVIPIDIDEMDMTRIPEYISIVEEVVGITRHEMGVVNSGHGLHFLLGLKKPITDEKYFKNNLSKYKLLCGEITQKLYFKGLVGNIDSGPFRSRSTLRVPSTENRKEGLPGVECVLLHSNILPKINLEEIIDNEVAPEASNEIKEYPAPDSEEVEKCLFLQHCKENQEVVKEPQWYAMMTIVSKLDDSGEKCHEYSRDHSKYREVTTQTKYEQAREVGPRTCTNIDSLWNGCSGCEYHGKCVSPITLKGKDHIATENTGFHHIIVDRNGGTKYLPDYEGLRRFFAKKHPYIVTDAKICYIWKGSHWEFLPDVYIETFAQKHFEPSANNTKINEFKNLILRTNIKPEDWFGTSTHGKMNFQNGVLILDTMEFSGHKKNIGFRSTLPYDYDPTAECPTFDGFMNDVTQNDKNLTDVLLEFAGYSFSGIRCKFDKALIMNGHGANGKSTFIRVLTAAAGGDAYSSLTLPEMQNEQNRQQMVGKLFNIAEEAPSRQGLDSATFKNLVSGGEMTIKVVYKTPYRARNVAKLIIACNELPDLQDSSHGMFRRLLIAPFNACFTGKEDFEIGERMELELPGIFNKIIAGYHRLMKQNRFSDSQRITEEVETFKSYTDNIQRWFDNEVSWEYTSGDVLDQKFITFEEIYKKYVFAIEDNHEKPEPFRRFVYRSSKFIPASRKKKRRISGENSFAGPKMMIHGIIINNASMNNNREF